MLNETGQRFVENYKFAICHLDGNPKQGFDKFINFVRNARPIQEEQYYINKVQTTWDIIMEMKRNEVFN